MDQYQEYTLEDFVLDARFQGWVRHRGAADAVFWQQYLDENPAQADDIQSARKLLDSVYRHYRTDIDEAEIDLEIQGLLERVRAEKQRFSAQVAGGSMEEREEGEERELVIEEKSGVVRTIPSGRPWYADIWMKVAACTVLAIGLGWVGWQYYRSNNGYNGLVSGKELVERVNTSGKQQVIKLMDGTQVVLYPQSRLSFAETFPADQRTVYLSGDAYFQVAKDPKRPFLVHTTDLVTKVLGTSFFVRARDASDKTLVEVREGKVSVFKQKEFAARRNVQSKMPNGMVLTPNQKLIFEHASSEMRRTLSDNPEIVPSDNPKTFEFVNTPASSVLTDIEEAYQIDIIFDRDVMKGCPVTASLGGQPMFSKLSILCEVIEARYEVLDGKIVIYSKGCKS
ncbi:FecR family protein [Dyadobacter fermentans]|uniref:FecR family protein n=1 Tax=Dyadobacter fermentans TaxID=94254 RepID=UPI001CC1918F|nr:FecR family protein [Dyadobacter fermentans]MBZ1362319.1 FecR family protein [Dyadobacter fermentans]